MTLGKNVKSIAKNAFASGKKLSKLSIKAKLSSVGKGAFEGYKKKIKVWGTSKYDAKRAAAPIPHNSPLFIPLSLMLFEKFSYMNETLNTVFS